MDGEEEEEVAMDATHVLSMEGSTRAEQSNGVKGETWSRMI